jgi:hypothetical protein
MTMPVDTIIVIGRDTPYRFLDLGKPVIFHEERLHGHAASAGASYPQPIGRGMICLDSQNNS